MASGWTNRGKYLVLGAYFKDQAEPTNFYIALVTSAAVPDADTNTLSQLTQIADGNGYDATGTPGGGYQLARNSTDWPDADYTQDQTNDLAVVMVKDVVWTAAGGPIPASGSGARYAVLTDDNATIGSRQVIAFFDLVSDRSVSDAQTLTLQDLELRIV